MTYEIEVKNTKKVIHRLLWFIVWCEEEMGDEKNIFQQNCERCFAFDQNQSEC
jgi:hypothetical protein